MHAGGSPNFEEMDAKRTEMNEAILKQLAGAADPSVQIDLLLAMQGRVFNLANTVSADLTQKVKGALCRTVTAAADSLDRESSRSLAQNLLDLAGMPKEEGLINCNPIANGWIFTNVLSAEAQSRVRAVHERQWGRPTPGG